MTMNERPALADLHAFAAIAQLRSFRKAADALALSPSTLSHMLRGLEARLGVRLLHRTTRSVAPTEEGARMLSQLQPLLLSLDQVLAQAGASSPEPAGMLRINTTEIGAHMLLERAVPTLLRRHPRMEVDLVTDGRLIDIVAEGFDAGVRLRESVPQDMVAVPLRRALRFLTVASPAYLKKHPAPLRPEDLKQHRCIRYRMCSGKRYRWEFERGGQSVAIDVPGALTLDHVDLMAHAAADGQGIAYLSDYTAAPWLKRDKLAVVLEPWCPPASEVCLYYPGHRLVPRGLQALIEVLREHHG